MSRTLGVIGLGRMGYRIVLAARQAGLDVVSILDTAEEPWGIQQDPSLASITHRDADAFWRDPPEMIAIATLATHHVPLLRTALENGVRRVLVEKPLACSVAEAEEAVHLQRQHDARVVVNHGYRYTPLFQRIRALSGTPRMGTLRSILISMGGAGYACVGTHYFDLMNWMFDATPERIMAVATEPEAPNPRGSHLDDRGGAVLLEYPDGRRGILELGDDVGVVGGMQFRFEYGFVDLENESDPPRHRQRRHDVLDKPKSFYGAPLEDVAWEPFEAFDAVRAARAALEDLAADSPVVVGPEEGLAAIEMFIAARLAGERRQSIALPLTGKDREVYYPVP